MGDEPTLSWQPDDTSALTYLFAVGSAGLTVSFGLLAASAMQHFSRTEKQSETDTYTEATALLEHGNEHAIARPCWRVIFLVATGFSPLVSCVLVGETLGSVLFAMVAMHWVVMLVLPALYYTIRSHGEEDFAVSTMAFYRDLWDRNFACAWAKSIRGCLLGAPIFLCLLSGFVAFRCKTFLWAFCIRNFERPLEDFGFRPHSMPFRVLAAFYFTFWNPVIEEFFWRVFLHRELGSELGFKEKTSETSDTPWQQLWQDILAALPSWPARDTCWTSAAVYWGVSVMYASYHTWPMKVLFVFNFLPFVHIVAGFLFLVCLGRFFIILREAPDFGLPAAYFLHMWVDAAFALICLFEIHPEELADAAMK